eukprot:TRINITY_DN733_c0_g1_i1.p1 TRINITY_DN733_c0_g1~~TRINITY_DN733_c0_g1_i1.p1  ORF type:complete len:518 (+),score=104.57 TRINITY_DN733_c0_g1_i1:72-1556(+)
MVNFVETHMGHEVVITRKADGRNIIALKSAEFIDFPSTEEQACRLIGRTLGNAEPNGLSMSALGSQLTWPSLGKKRFGSLAKLINKNRHLFRIVTKGEEKYFVKLYPSFAESVLSDRDFLKWTTSQDMIEYEDTDMNQIKKDNRNNSRLSFDSTNSRNSRPNHHKNISAHNPCMVSHSPTMNQRQINMGMQGMRPARQNDRFPQAFVPQQLFHQQTFFGKNDTSNVYNDDIGMEQQWGISSRESPVYHCHRQHNHHYHNGRHQQQHHHQHHQHYKKQQISKMVTTDSTNVIKSKQEKVDANLGELDVGMDRLSQQSMSVSPSEEDGLMDECSTINSQRLPVNGVQYHGSSNVKPPNHYSDGELIFHESNLEMRRNASVGQSVLYQQQQQFPHHIYDHQNAYQTGDTRVYGREFNKPANEHIPSLPHTNVPHSNEHSHLLEWTNPTMNQIGDFGLTRMRTNHHQAHHQQCIQQQEKQDLNVLLNALMPSKLRSGS